MNDKDFLDILDNELIISLGCTEPVAIAYASSLAKYYVEGKIVGMNVVASRNVIKNAMNVKIPGTNDCGIELAAALGTYSKNPGRNFELFAEISPEDLKNAYMMLKNKLVKVCLADSTRTLYIEVQVRTEISESRVVIEDTHDNVVFIEADGEILKNCQKDDIHLDKDSNHKSVDSLNLDSILNFIDRVDTSKLVLIRECINLNKRICLEGIEQPYGLNVGRSILSNMEAISNDMANNATALTSAGVDARMSGSNLPVMTNSGSGNLGISTTVPVLVCGESLNSPWDDILRAVTLSNLITIYIKSKMGRLSVICGATISATGSCCGITYLMGGGKSEIMSSIQNMMGNITGIICDGAKAGCALKIASCTAAAIQCSKITMDGNSIDPREGIIALDAEGTIKNFCELGNSGMKGADKMILDIMLEKMNRSF